MSKLIELISDEVEVEYGDDSGVSDLSMDYHKRIGKGRIVKKVLNEELKESILEGLKTTNILSSQLIENDTMLQNNDDSLITPVSNGEINLTIFKWLVEEVKIFNLKGNIEHRYFVIDMFATLIEESGETSLNIDFLPIDKSSHDELVKEYLERKYELIRYMFSWLGEEIPIALCSEKKIFEACLESSAIFAIDYCFHYLLDMCAFHGLKLPDSEILILIINRFSPSTLERALQFCDPKEIDIHIIFDILYYHRYLKNEDSIILLANCIEIVMEKIGNMNINDIEKTPVREGIFDVHFANPEEEIPTVDLNITDYLTLYGWNYPSSPIMKIFNNFTLPPPTGNTPKIINRFHSLSSAFPIENYFQEHQFTKDPAKYSIMLQELKQKEAEGYRLDHWRRKPLKKLWKDVPLIYNYIISTK